MKASESGFARTTAREFAVLAVAALGAYLFFIHGSLYLQPGSAARPLTFEGFLLVTTILYLLLRLIFVVASLYYPRARPAYVVCPDCGRALEDDATKTAERHRKHPLSPKPTEKEVLAAIMLRKAIDDARRSARKDLSGPRAHVVRLPGNPENLPLPMDELERILRDLDKPRGSRGSQDRTPRAPPGPPP